MRRWPRILLGDEAATSAVEYAAILGVVALSALAAGVYLGTGAGNAFSRPMATPSAAVAPPDSGPSPTDWNVPSPENDQFWLIVLLGLVFTNGGLCGGLIYARICRAIQHERIRRQVRASLEEDDLAASMEATTVTPESRACADELAQRIDSRRMNRFTPADANAPQAIDVNNASTDAMRSDSVPKSSANIETWPILRPPRRDFP